MSINRLMVVAAIAILSLVWLQFTLLKKSTDSANAEFEHIVANRIVYIGEVLENNFYCYRTESQVYVPSSERFYLLNPLQGASIDKTGEVVMGQLDTLESHSNDKSLSFLSFGFGTHTKINIHFDFEYLPLIAEKSDSSYNGAEKYVLKNYKNYILDVHGERLIDTMKLEMLVSDHIRSIKGAELCEYRVLANNRVEFESNAIHEDWYVLKSETGLYRSNLLPQLQLELYFPKKEFLLLSSQWP